MAWEQVQLSRGQETKTSLISQKTAQVRANTFLYLFSLLGFPGAIKFLFNVIACYVMSKIN